jgi:DNA-binding CsgD family transcriptional regulator
MQDDPTAAEMHEIATSTLPLPERAQGLLETLERWLPVEATWLALSDPQSNVYATIGSTQLEDPVLDYLDRPSVGREIQLAGLHKKSWPVSLRELPTPAEELPTWAECLIPAGFREGLGVPLFEPGGLYLGMLTLLFTTSERPSQALRDRLVRLAPLIARAVSPMRSLRATARLVQDATYGAVLLADGTTYPLPGLRGHPLLAAGSVVVDLARQTLLSGQVYRSFMWPFDDGLDSPNHARMTILAATEVPAFVLGTLLITPSGDCEGLTPRELVVLGLVVNGYSNQQMARRLRVTPRTVAAHVEHLLQKLDVPTRTSAAVRAERDGCYVPQPP